MSDAIERRVEQFVQEVLVLVERVSIEHRAAAMSTVTTALAEAGRHPRARTSSVRSAAASAASQGVVTSPRGGRSPTRHPRPATGEVAVPAAAAPVSPSGAAVGIAGAAKEEEAPTSAEAPASAPDQAASQLPGREAQVLDAVRALGRATAIEVAERSGQPNGSVVVALRALVARGLVARTKAAGGVEYSLVSAGSVRPFKRVRDLGTADQASAADVALVAD